MLFRSPTRPFSVSLLQGRFGTLYRIAGAMGCYRQESSDSVDRRSLARLAVLISASIRGIEPTRKSQDARTQDAHQNSTKLLRGFGQETREHCARGVEVRGQAMSKTATHLDVIDLG